MRRREANKINDRDIITLLHERNEEALRVIAERYGRLIRKIAINITDSAECADECLNDTLFDVWNTIPPQDPISISSYVSMLSRRRAIDRVRNATAAKRDRTAFTAVGEEFAEVADGLDERLDSIRIQSAVNAFLRHQAPTNREIFISRYFDFEPIESISARLHMTPNAVKIRLNRMRKKLRSDLQKGGVPI